MDDDLQTPGQDVSAGQGPYAPVPAYADEAPIPDPPEAPVATEPGCTHPDCILEHPHAGPAILGGRYLARQSFLAEAGDYIAGAGYLLTHDAARPLVDAGLLELA